MLCVVQVYMRKGRLLLSLQAVKHALKLAGPAHPDVHRLIVRFCKAVQQQQQHSTDQVTCCICTKVVCFVSFFFLLGWFLLWVLVELQASPLCWSESSWQWESSTCWMKRPFCVSIPLLHCCIACDCMRPVHHCYVEHILLTIAAIEAAMASEVCRHKTGCRYHQDLNYSLTTLQRYSPNLHESVSI